jgi:putative heme transporter
VNVEPEAGATAPGTTRSRAKSVRKIVVRILIVVLAIGGSAFLLASTFDELDLDAVADALRSLDDAEVIALLAMWFLWIGSQGLLTASLAQGMPVRRGVLAYLGPAAVTAVVPGPSDLPVRYRMFTSWGRDPGETTLAVAANGVFSIGIKLVLPVIAAIGLVVADAPLDGTLRTIVYIALVVGLLVVIVAFVLGSEKNTTRVGRWLEPVWRLVTKLMRRPDSEELAELLRAARTRSLEVLRKRWRIATWATFLTAGARFALLLMALRFTGVPESAIGWPQVFVVYAVVQGLTVLPITPGDAGVSELAYVGLLTAAAGSQWVNQITAGVIIFRVLTWLALIPVGLAALAVWHVALRRSSSRATAPAESMAPVEPVDPAP